MAPTVTTRIITQWECARCHLTRQSEGATEDVDVEGFTQHAFIDIRSMVRDPDGNLIKGPSAIGDLCDPCAEQAANWFRNPPPRTA